MLEPAKPLPLTQKKPFSRCCKASQQQSRYRADMVTIHRLGAHLLGKSNEFTELDKRKASRLGQTLIETSSMVDMLNHCAIDVNDNAVMVSFVMPRHTLKRLTHQQERVAELVFNEHFLQAAEENDTLYNDLMMLFETVAHE